MPEKLPPRLGPTQELAETGREFYKRGWAFGASGNFSWRGHAIRLTRVLQGEDVGLLPVSDGLWTVYFGAVRLGHFDARLGRMKKPD